MMTLLIVSALFIAANIILKITAHTGSILHIPVTAAKFALVPMRRPW
jgi:hypothetical protein